MQIFRSAKKLKIVSLSGKDMLPHVTKLRDIIIQTPTIGSNHFPSYNLKPLSNQENPLKPV